MENEEQKQAWWPRFYHSWLGEILQVIIISLIVVIPFRMYIAQPFLVSGPSMDDTFHDGQYLIVDELTYHNRDPKRGEVVIFKYPLDQKKYFIKRIIGLPGETIEIKNNQVIISNQIEQISVTLAEPYVRTDKLSAPRSNHPITLGPDQYYVLGDNRQVSSDSRIWGAVHRDLITGRPFLRLYPFYEIDLWPGQITNT